MDKAPTGGDLATARAELETQIRSTPLELTLARAWTAVVSPVVAGPLARSLRRLEIHASDWQELHRIVEALATNEFPNLETLVLGVAEFEELMRRGTLYETAFQVGPIVSAELIRRLATATPGLRELSLVGHRLFAGIEHPGLERLVACGDPIDGCPFVADSPRAVRPRCVLPSVRRIEHVTVRDEYRPFPTRNLRLEGVPALRELVFRGDYIGYSEATPFGVIGECSVLPQLRLVAFPELDGSRDGPKLETLAARFLHLEEFRVDALAIDETDEGSEDLEHRIRTALPNLALGRTISA